MVSVQIGDGVLINQPVRGTTKESLSMTDAQQLAKLTVEVTHIKEKVDHIDNRLESLDMGSRIAVLEDRQGVIFKLIHGTIGLFGTVLGGIILWLFTKS